MMYRLSTLLLVAITVVGCSSRDAELDRFIEQTKQEQPGGVEPLPEVKPSDSFDYEPAGMRSPFLPGTSAEVAGASVRPSSRRNREYLEQFTLDSLAMAGTITKQGRTYGMVKTKDRQVLLVLPGNYLGQNEGRITSIEPSKINIIEVVPDGLGNYMERAAALTRNE